jgi:cytoskeletal protein RodZ
MTADGMGDTRGRKLDIGNEARGGTGPASAGPAKGLGNGPTNGIADGSVRGPGVSDLLRSRRLSLGYELSEIALALRIRLAYLEAIEEGRFNDLPGATYANGFLRTYAEHLGLDPQLVLRRFKEETSGGLTAKPELYLPKPAPESRIPGGALLLLAVVLAGSAYGGWYYINSTGRELVDFVPELPDRLASALNIAPSAPAPGLVVPVTPTEPPPSAVASARMPAAPSSSPPPSAVAAAPPAHPPAMLPRPHRTRATRKSSRSSSRRRSMIRARRRQHLSRPFRQPCRHRPHRWRGCRCRQRHPERRKRGRAMPASMAPPAVSRVFRSVPSRIAGSRSATVRAIC